MAGARLAIFCAAAFLPSALHGAIAQEVSSLGKMPVLDPAGPAFGAYDPHGDFKDVAGDTIEHVFMPWRDVDLSTLADADDYAYRRGRRLLITIEPWSWSGTSNSTRAQLRNDILAGRDDVWITNACKAIAGLKSRVTIRWSQEMENPATPFPWSGWAPADFVAAFRRVVDICRPLARRAKFMWSPQGEPGLAAYYPGNAYVDEIGLSLFALQRYDRDKYGRDRSFAEMLKPKYERVAGFGKPICIAELGYSGDEAYNRRWARAITAKNAAFPDLGCVVYFDENDPHAWPAPYGKPHWRIKSSDGD